MAENPLPKIANTAIVKETSKIVKDVVSDIHGLLKSEARKLHPDNIISKLSGGNFLAMKSYDFFKSVTLGTGKDIINAVKGVGNKEIAEEDTDTQKITQAVEETAAKTQDDLQNQTETFSVFYQKQEDFLKNIKESVGDIHNIIYAMLRRNRNERLTELEKEREQRRLNQYTTEKMLEALKQLDMDFLNKNKPGAEGEGGPLDTHGFLGTFLGNIAGKLGLKSGGLFRKIVSVLGKGVLGAFSLGVLSPKFIKGIKNIPKTLIDPETSVLTKSGFLSKIFGKAVLGILKGVTFWLPLILGIFDGIMEGWKEYKKTGSVWKAIKYGIAGLIDFISFGLISKDDVVKVLNSIGGLVESLHIPQMLTSLYENIKGAILKQFDKLEQTMSETLGFNFEDIFKDIKRFFGDFKKGLLIIFPQKLIKIVFGLLDSATAKVKIVGRIVDAIYDFFENIFASIIDAVRSTKLGRLILDPFLSDNAEYESDKRMADRIINGPTKEQIAKAKDDLTRENEVVNNMVKKYGTEPATPQAKARLDREVRKLQMMKDDYNRMIAPKVTPPTNQPSENRAKAHEEGRKNLQEQTENLNQQKPTPPAIVNAPTNTIVNNNTSAVIGTSTQNTDITIERMTGRSYGLIPSF